MKNLNKKKLKNFDQTNKSLKSKNLINPKKKSYT